MKKKLKKTARVSDEAFVRAWAKSKSVGEVAAAVGLGYSGAQARARLLRSAGVRLPAFARITRRQRIDVAALNALLKPATSSR